MENYSEYRNWHGSLITLNLPQHNCFPSPNKTQSQFCNDEASIKFEEITIIEAVLGGMFTAIAVQVIVVVCATATAGIGCRKSTLSPESRVIRVQFTIHR